MQSHTSRVDSYSVFGHICNRGRECSARGSAEAHDKYVATNKPVDYTIQSMFSCNFAFALRESKLRVRDVIWQDKAFVSMFEAAGFEGICGSWCTLVIGRLEPRTQDPNCYTADPKASSNPDYTRRDEPTSQSLFQAFHSSHFFESLRRQGPGGGGGGGGGGGALEPQTTAMASKCAPNDFVSFRCCCS